MRVRIGQQDERLIVPLPKPLADQIALRKGSEVILTLEGGRLVLTPLSNGGQYRWTNYWPGLRRPICMVRHPQVLS